MPYALINSSVLRWLQKQDDDEDKSQTAAGKELQAAGPETVNLRDPYRHYCVRNAAMNLITLILKSTITPYLMV